MVHCTLIIQPANGDTSSWKASHNQLDSCARGLHWKHGWANPNAQAATETACKMGAVPRTYAQAGCRTQGSGVPWQTGYTLHSLMVACCG